MLPKQRTRGLETRVLIKSRVLKTRDASFTHSFKTGQLTKLLEILCYLERVFVFAPCIAVTKLVKVMIVVRITDYFLTEVVSCLTTLLVQVCRDTRWGC